MAKVCDSCGKKPSVGHLISHSNRKTLRRYLPNLVKKKMFNEATGRLENRKICTACMRTLVKIPKVRGNANVKG